jgi:hypothetical protein
MCVLTPIYKLQNPCPKWKKSRDRDGINLEYKSFHSANTTKVMEHDHPISVHTHVHSVKAAGSGSAMKVARKDMIWDNLPKYCSVHVRTHAIYKLQNPYQYTTKDARRAVLARDLACSVGGAWTFQQHVDRIDGFLPGTSEPKIGGKCRRARCCLCGKK